MKIRLVFERPMTDYITVWPDVKEVDVEVPDDIVYPPDEQGMRHVIGAVIPEKEEQIGGMNEEN